MNLWSAVPAGTVGAALLFTYRWFLLKTDVLVGYNWSWQGPNFYPNLDIRNCSGSRTYVLANIVYTKNNGKEVITLDNRSLWGHELRPGTISHLQAAPALVLNSARECFDIEVRVRLQNGREVKGQGPGQPYKGIRKLAFALRQRMEKSSLPLAS